MTADAAHKDDGPSPGPSVRTWAALGACFLASSVLLALAEWMAARGDARWHYYVFWIGYALAVGPAAWHMLRRQTPGAVRGALVVALGIWSLAPLLLRTGNHPLLFDEFSHFRMLQDLVRTGHPVSRVGLLQIGANFPGVELVTSALYHLSGLTLWIAALVVAAAAHVALLTGIYVLVKDAASSSRAGALAALVYSLNPSWLIFDAQFSYETLAIPMLVWVLVFALRGARQRADATGARNRSVLIGVAAVLMAGLVVTHSVTSAVCALALTGIAIVATLQRRGILRSEVVTSTSIAWGVAAWAVVITILRFVNIGHPLVQYLGPTFHVSQQLRQLLSLFGIGKGLPLHAAFASSSAPGFEIVCAYAMLPVLGIAFIWASWGLLGARGRISPLVYVAFVLSLLFFVSVPLDSAATYSEAVHRSWAFSFIGFAVLLGVAGGLALDGHLAINVRRRVLWPPALRHRLPMRPAIVACAAVVAIGSASLGSSTAYRFGGKVAPQTDPLYVGTQTAMVASWFARHATPSDVVFANRFVIRPIAIASRGHIIQPGGTESHLILTISISYDELFAYRHDRVSYIVYDRRTGKVGNVRPWFWYVSNDSQLPRDARGQHAFTYRLGCLDWVHAVFATTDYQVLRVDQGALERDLDLGHTGLDKRCQAAVFHG